MRNFNRGEMQSKKSRLVLILPFIFIILSVPVYWLIRDPNPYQRSWLEGRYLEDFAILNRGFYRALKDLAAGDPALAKDVFTKEFVKGAFQQDLESAASDQFPIRFTFIMAEKTAERAMIRMAYAFLPDPAIPADMRSEFFITRDQSAMIYGPNVLQASTFDVIDERIENYAALIQAYPEINFNVYYIERIQDTAYHPLDTSEIALERGQYFQHFIENKPDDLVVEKLDINSFEDHLKYFYHTDHHWNIHGILLAYQEIYQMLAVNYPEISAIQAVEDFFTFSDIRFHGSEARKSFHPLWETFEAADFNLPSYTVYDNGVEIVYGSSADYLQGEYPHDPYYNHYEGFFGGDKALLTFEFENQAPRSLLVIGNSYDNAILPLLASHYTYTYNVDLRYYNDFRFSAFLEEHPVDDVLVIGENTVTFTSRNYAIQP